VAIYPSPGAVASSSLTNPNNLGAPLVFRVTAVMGPWVQVMLPMRPNGARGWIQRADVQLYADPYQVVVHLGSHSLSLLDQGAVVETHPIISGMPSAPTPTGDFYVTELLKAPNPAGPYGPYAFGLSAFSDTYSEFEGGPGQIAIHGTNQPYLMGQSASHGCVRVTNDVVAHLAGILPLGSPVLIAG
jgi:lipoprotein-anchoring transpeptidase ErfK/SrfK